MKVVKIITTVLLLYTFINLVFFILGEYLIPPNPIIETKLTKDQKKLSRLISMEADPTDTLDMYLVGSSVLNRAYRSSNFPSTIDSVIFQYRQYATIDTNYLNKTDPRIDEIVVNLYNGIGRDYNVLYFYNPDIATDTIFKRFCRNRGLLYKTKKHLYF